MAKEQAVLKAHELRNEAGGALRAAQAALTLDQGLSNAGEIKVQGELQASAQTLDNQASGTLLADTASLALRDDAANGGQIKVKQLTLAAKGLNNRQGGMIQSDNVRLTLQEDMDNAGDISAKTLTATARSLSNAAGGMLRADQAALTLSQDLRNAGQIKTKQLTLSGKGLSNQDGALIQSDTADLKMQEDIDNAGQIKVAQLTADARTLTNQASGQILVDDAVLKTQTLANAGTIRASNDLSATTHDYRNTGEFSAGHDLTLVIKNPAGLTIDAEHRSPIANGTLTLEAASIAVREGGVQNPGNVVMKATAGDIDNYEQIATPGVLTMTATGDINNHSGSLVWAGGDASLSAQTIHNQTDAWIISQDGDVTLKAAIKLRNEMGRIEAGRDLNADAPLIENLSQLSGDLRVSDSEHERVTVSKSLGYWSGGRWVKTQIGDFEVRKPVSTLKVKQGVMRAGGDMNLNQAEQKGHKAHVHNEGTMLAGKQLRVDGSVENRSMSKQLSVMDYLKMNTGNYRSWVMEVALPTGGHEGRFASLYDMLDFLLADHKKWISLGGAYWYVPTENLLPVLMSADMSQRPIWRRSWPRPWAPTGEVWARRPPRSAGTSSSRASAAGRWTSIPWRRP